MLVCSPIMFMIGKMSIILIIILYTISSSVCSLENVAALILARGGSKGIPLKNLQIVGGISLLARSIRVAKLSQLNVTVSTDHPAIALEAIKYGATLFHRSKTTASDYAPSIWGAAEYLNNRPAISILVLLQTTSPFLQIQYLKEALNKIEHFDCVFAVTRSYKLLWRRENGRVVPVNFEIGNRPRRQDWDGEMVETGAFYVSRRRLIENGYFQNHNCSVVEIPVAQSMEVDSPYDLIIANSLINAKL